MSVVAYKDGVLAADSKAYGGRYQSSPGTKRKIHRLADGSLIGITSNKVGDGERVVDWMNKGADPKDWGEGEPVFSALWVKVDGSVFLADDSLHFSGPIDCSAHAIGSGGQFAIGAMAMGATASEACLVAAQFDGHCGAPIHSLTLEQTDDPDRRGRVG